MAEMAMLEVRDVADLQHEVAFVMKPMATRLPPAAGQRLGHSEQKITLLICAVVQGRAAEPDSANGHAITRTSDAVQRSVD